MFCVEFQLEFVIKFFGLFILLIFRWISSSVLLLYFVNLLIFPEQIVQLFAMILSLPLFPVMNSDFSRPVRPHLLHVYVIAGTFAISLLIRSNNPLYSDRKVATMITNHVLCEEKTSVKAAWV